MKIILYIPIAGVSVLKYHVIDPITKMWGVCYTRSVSRYVTSTDKTDRDPVEKRFWAVSVMISKRFGSDEIKFEATKAWFRDLAAKLRSLLDVDQIEFDVHQDVHQVAVGRETITDTSDKPKPKTKSITDTIPKV